MTRRSMVPLVAMAFLGCCAQATADTVLITGANAGLGLEFARQYAAKGWTVIATHRRSSMPDTLTSLLEEYPETVRVERMDVASIPEVEALAAKLEGVPIDVLINNAGVFSDRSDCTDENCRGEDNQTFGDIDYDLFDLIMTVNVRGPLIVSESFIDNVRAGEQKKIISMSSTNGSLTQPLPGAQGIAYRASKAALNRAMQLVAVKEQEQGVLVLMLHPGTVVTDRLIGNRGLPGTVDPEPSVAGMIRVIEQATMADTGKFLQYDGTIAPW
jgi:NAD(P)-dependent dehydrogenase (short-subunit alcohol dehydrogenase family)